MSERLMPTRLHLGRYSDSVIGFILSRKKEVDEGDVKNLFNYRQVLGFFLPSWQRELVWSKEQNVLLIESAWKGINIGTFTYNTGDINSPYDNLLIDGQQRMNAFACYFNDEFPVFGYKWSEVTAADRRQFLYSTHFASYELRTEDEQELRDYYNLMNFGGVRHKESERA